MRYQQKQKEEIERKRSELAGLSATTAIDLNENSKIHIGKGKVCRFGRTIRTEKPSFERMPNEFALSNHKANKNCICIQEIFFCRSTQVRQMFDERRQRVTGIDKSYPLQPISTKTSANSAPRTTTVSRPRTHTHTCSLASSTRHFACKC